MGHGTCPQLLDSCHDAKGQLRRRNVAVGVVVEAVSSCVVNGGVGGGGVVAVMTVGVAAAAAVSSIAVTVNLDSWTWLKPRQQQMADCCGSER